MLQRLALFSRLLIIAVLGAGHLSAADTLVPHPAIARIIAFEPNGQLYGSGSYVGSYGQYGIVITNWHVVSDTKSLVHVHFPTGFASYGYVVRTDRKWDLAVVVISRPPVTITPLMLASDVPRVGESLWIAGYGAGAFRVAGGRCQRYLAPEIPKEGEPEYEYLELSVAARQGDSGGPILNRYGEIVGVLFGSDSRNTAGSHCGRMRRFLSDVSAPLATLPTHPESLFASVEPGGPRRPLTATARPIRVEPVVGETSVVAHSTTGGIARSATSSFGIPTAAQPMVPLAGRQR